MRILIDARFYGPIGKGVGRYSQKLIEYLEKVDFKNQYFIFLRKGNFDLYQPTNPNFKKVLADYPWYSFKEQLMMPIKIHKMKPDLVHFCHFNAPLFYSGKFVVTIHDLIHNQTDKKSSLKKWPVFYFKKFFYFLVLKSAIRRAKKIITVSQFTKNEIIKKYKIKPEKIVVTYEASDKPIAAQKLKIENCKLKIGNYLLYVGNAYPHKNLERLVEAFKLLTNNLQLTTYNRLKLVLVGKIDFFYQKLQKLVKELEIDNKIIFIGAVSDEELKNLYQNALLYVFPSLAEGFGLPGLEAMAYGLAVVSSNAGSLPEIYEKAAIYFDPKNINQIVEIIKKAIEDQSLRNELIKKGLEQVKKYSWEKCAQQTLEIYHSV